MCMWLWAPQIVLGRNICRLLSASGEWWWHGQCCTGTRALWDCSNTSTKSLTGLGLQFWPCFHLKAAQLFNFIGGPQIWLGEEMLDVLWMLLWHYDGMEVVVLLRECCKTVALPPSSLQRVVGLQSLAFLPTQCNILQQYAGGLRLRLYLDWNVGRLLSAFREWWWHGRCCAASTVLRKCCHTLVLTPTSVSQNSDWPFFTSTHHSSRTVCGVGLRFLLEWNAGRLLGASRI